jgi:hypothetical protein
MPRDYSPTWSQRKFAEEYVQHGDIERAAAAAGSKAIDKKTAGYRFRSNPKVQRLIEELRAEVRDRVTRTAAETIHDANELIDEAVKIARAGKPIIAKDGTRIRDDDGKVITHPDTTAMLKAAELKGKSAGMFIDRQKIEGEMDGMSDEQLAALIEGEISRNKMLLERVATMDAVIAKVLENERRFGKKKEANDERDAQHGESRSGDRSAEAESLPSSPEASRVPRSGLH